MSKYLTGYLISRTKDGLLTKKVVNFQDTLPNLYKLVNCELVEMPTRYINNVPYNFIIDEEGLLHDRKPINALSSNGKEFLVGNILITGLADQDGNLTSLEINDIVNISNAIRKTGYDTLLIYNFGERCY